MTACTLLLKTRNTAWIRRISSQMRRSKATSRIPFLSYLLLNRKHFKTRKKTKQASKNQSMPLHRCSARLKCSERLCRWTLTSLFLLRRLQAKRANLQKISKKRLRAPSNICITRRTTVRDPRHNIFSKRIPSPELSSPRTRNRMLARPPIPVTTLIIRSNQL